MRAIRELPSLFSLKRLRSAIVSPLHAVLELPFFVRLGVGVKRLAEAGTAPYPPDVRRRLKILNMMAYLIAVTTFLYAIQQSLMDFHTFAPMIILNLALVFTALMVPLAHRINEIAGGLLIVGAEYVALFGFTSFFSRDGGAQLQYIIAAAAPFVIFDLRRLRLIALIVLLGLILHLCAWFWFPALGLTEGQQAAADSLYTQAAVTTIVLIAASVYYAFSLAERAKAETDAVLRNVLPDPIVERLKANPGAVIADSINDATIMFADISGFVALARHAPRRGKDQDHWRRLHGGRRRARSGARPHRAHRPHGARHARQRCALARRDRPQHPFAHWHCIRAGDCRCHRHPQVQLRRMGRSGEPGEPA
jgi:hypothetical protein